MLFERFDPEQFEAGVRRRSGVGGICRESSHGLSTTRAGGGAWKGSSHSHAASYLFDALPGNIQSSDCSASATAQALTLFISVLRTQRGNSISAVCWRRRSGGARGTDDDRSVTLARGLACGGPKLSPHYKYPPLRLCSSRLFFWRWTPYHRRPMSKHKAVTKPKAGGRRPNRPRASVPARAIVSCAWRGEGSGAPFRSSIAQLLDAPEFVALVPRLPPETLHALVRHGGLEACGDLIAAATPAQLMSVLDLDLWRHAHVGQDDQFDAHRFGEWLELLAETGASVSARIVAGARRRSRGRRAVTAYSCVRSGGDRAARVDRGRRTERRRRRLRTTVLSVRSAATSFAGPGTGHGMQSSRCSVSWRTTIRTAFTP